MVSTLNSTTKIAATIQKLQDFISNLSNENDLATIKDKLEIIKSSLQGDKLNLQIIGVDNNSTKGCYKLIKEHRNIPKYYDLQTVTFPNQPTITYRDILCLVIDSEERLSRDAKHMIKYLSHSKLIKLLVVIDMLNDNEETIQDIQSYITESKDRIIQYNPDIEVDFFIVSLKSHYSNPDKKRDIKAKSQLDKLCQQIENIAKYKIKEILLDSPRKQVREQIEKIEDILNSQEKAVEAHKQGEQSKIRNLNFSYGEIKKEIDLTYKKIDRERDKFFKFCRERLSIWSNSLLDDYDIRGIKYKIKQETDKITLVRREPWGKYLLRGGKATLIPKNKDTLVIHKDLIYVYQDILNENFNREWNNICTKYYCNGLDTLRSNTYKTLNSSFGVLVEPPKELKNDTEQKTISRFFDATKKQDFEWNSSYACAGFFAFITKDLRSQIMSISSLILLLSSSIIKQGTDKGAIIGFIIFPIVIGSIAGYIQKTYEKEQAEIDKIKKDGYNYYQSLGKYYVNRVQNFINAQLNIEEQNLKDLLDEYKESLNEHIINVENKIQTYNEKLTNLQKQKNELSKLVREL